MSRFFLTIRKINMYALNFVHFQKNCTSCYILFLMRTMLKSRVYCNDQNPIHLYSFIAKITEFRFAHVAYSIVDSIIFTPPLV